MSLAVFVRKVDVGRPVVPHEVRTVAICAGSGGSVLSGVDADVYFTGEMSHVRPFGFLCCLSLARGLCVLRCPITTLPRPRHADHIFTQKPRTDRKSVV